jgi:hypothetical protein
MQKTLPTIVSTNDKANFLELAIPAQSSTDPATTPCDVSLQSGTAPVISGGVCPADLDGDGRCTVVDIQRIINYQSGLGCKVGS